MHSQRKSSCRISCMAAISNLPSAIAFTELILLDNCEIGNSSVFLYFHFKQCFFRLAHNVTFRRISDYFAFVNNHYPTAQCLHFLHNMRRKQHGTVFSKIAYQSPYFDNLVRSRPVVGSSRISTCGFATWLAPNSRVVGNPSTIDLFFATFSS